MTVNGTSIVQIAGTECWQPMSPTSVKSADFYSGGKIMSNMNIYTKKMSNEKCFKIEDYVKEASKE